MFIFTLLVALYATNPPFDRFFMMVLENKDYLDVIRDPYMGNSLASRGRLLANSYAIRHPSQPNYIAMVAGTTGGIYTDFTHNLTIPTIVDLLEEKNRTWQSYQENYPGT
jgi:hypothetical protein